MGTPKRIQRRRTKGWRMPEGCLFVGRPTIWGNPWKVGEGLTVQDCVDGYRELMNRRLSGPVRFYWRFHLAELRGADLSCWCAEGTPCHADVLLELANKEEG